MRMFGTGVSDEYCKVAVKPAPFGGFYADYGHFATRLFRTPREAANEGNRLGQQVYGTTIRLVDINQFRG
jgi:hypothetical protein